ncbi:MAG: deoxyribose-phosphate aldolase [Bacteroidetes bacterium 46-16]|nr:MAG: deoxyribose-phosphate aldolase [Bacteroidetes bacterium 46-16]
MNIASYIDHTILKPTTTADDIERLCQEAKEYGFAAVCVPPYFLAEAGDFLGRDRGIKFATVIDFPFGYSMLEAKLAAIEEAITYGADEIDLVHNIGAMRSGDWEQNEIVIEMATNLIHERGKIIKVIVESGILTDEELIACCDLYSLHDIDFMKTSTGYAEVGATTHAVKLMREHLPEHIQIKASGGIKSYAFAKELIDAGATRLGCSASVAIVKEAMQ